MPYLLATYLKPGAEERLIEFHSDFNEQLSRSEILIAGVMRDEHHHRVGYLAVLDVASREEAQSFLDDSPIFRAGLYDRTEIFDFQVEVGRLD